jgi:hypothetical protein
MEQKYGLNREASNNIQSIDEPTLLSLMAVSKFYDERKVGHVGPLGFRRSTDLSKLTTCIPFLIENGLLISGESLFMDLGCADGRVNVFFSYLVKLSIGIEIDEWILDEYHPLRNALDEYLMEKNLSLPPSNIHLFCGDSTSESVHKKIYSKIGACFEDFDIFYTYLTMYEEFGELIAKRAKNGSVFMVYGMEKILPRLNGLKLITPVALDGIIAIYQKPY